MSSPDQSDASSTHTMSTRSQSSIQTVPVTSTATQSVKPIDKHPTCWDSENHYGQCGQSCPCCRARAGDSVNWGACPLC